MSKLAGLVCLGALLALTGCVTPPGDGSKWETISTNTPPPPPRPVLPSVPLTNPPVAKTNPPPVRVVKAPPTYSFQSLARWAAEQKIPAPVLLAKAPLVKWAIRSPRGTLILAAGSREATWNGVTFHLGFAPEMANGQLVVHGFDVRKNLEPLLTDAPLAFPETNRVIVIDPGHGGINSGTVCPFDRTTEKEFTLDWARRLAPLLAANGWTVHLTRTNDVDVSLSNRVAFAEARRADVFLSLHFNSAAPDKKQSGLETYCLTPQGLPSTLTRGNPDPLSQRFPNNAFDAENFQLAVRLHTALLRAGGAEDRGVRRARFMGVLTGQRRPAVLVEGGFLSNRAEATRIQNPEYRQKLAAALAEVLK